MTSISQHWVFWTKLVERPRLLVSSSHPLRTVRCSSIWCDRELPAIAAASSSVLRGANTHARSLLLWYWIWVHLTVNTLHLWLTGIIRSTSAYFRITLVSESICSHKETARFYLCYLPHPILPGISGWFPWNSWCFFASCDPLTQILE